MSDPDPHQSERRDPDPHQSKKRNADPHQSENRDLDPHQSDRRDPGIYIQVKGGIWISNKVMQIRNTLYHTKNKITAIGQKIFITKEQCHYNQEYHKTF
jgi:hypothetical protein